MDLKSESQVVIKKIYFSQLNRNTTVEIVIKYNCTISKINCDSNKSMNMSKNI